DLTLPACERGADQFPQLRTFCRHLQTETPHHASGYLTRLAVGFGQIGEVTLQAFQWRHAGVVQDARRMLSLVSDIPGEGSRSKGLLAAEVVIERALGQIRRLQNVR